VHDNCPQCPKNVLGSRITPQGKQSKECNDVRFVAVVTAADPSKVYGLTIPVSAMKAFRIYFKELSQYGLIPEEVVTTLGFDDQASFPKITFKHKGYVPEKHLATIEELAQMPETRQIIRVAQLPALTAPVSRPSLPSKPIEVAKAAEPKDVTPVPADEPVAVKEEKPAVREPHEFHSKNAKQEAVKEAKPVKGKAKPTPTEEAVSSLEKQLDDLFS
jgi:hypothetical protein